MEGCHPPKSGAGLSILGAHSWYVQEESSNPGASSVPRGANFAHPAAPSTHDDARDGPGAQAKAAARGRACKASRGTLALRKGKVQAQRQNHHAGDLAKDEPRETPKRTKTQRKEKSSQPAAERVNLRTCSRRVTNPK